MDEDEIGIPTHLREMTPWTKILLYAQKLRAGIHFIQIEPVIPPSQPRVGTTLQNDTYLPTYSKKTQQLPAHPTTLPTKVPSSAYTRLRTEMYFYSVAKHHCVCSYEFLWHFSSRCIHLQSGDDEGFQLCSTPARLTILLYLRRGEYDSGCNFRVSFLYGLFHKSPMI